MVGIWIITSSKSLVKISSLLSRHRHTHTFVVELCNVRENYVYTQDLTVNVPEDNNLDKRHSVLTIRILWVGRNPVHPTEYGH